MRLSIGRVCSRVKQPVLHEDRPTGHCDLCPTEPPGRVVALSKLLVM